MKISEVISKMKAYHKGEVNGVRIDEETTRDKILYGNPDQDCSGIVTTCWASVEVIRKAHELGANLIICHEALFWYRGDKTDWLVEADNKTFLKKKQLLDDTGIVVWRDHDYVHSGIPMGEGYVDGIFYGVMELIGWKDYLVDSIERPMVFEIPETTIERLGKELIASFGLNGLKVIGELDSKVKKVAIASHIMGEIDKYVITQVDQQNIDALICLEVTDYTVSEYIRDSGMLGLDKAILAVGHFNTEEPGMEYMVNYIPEAIGADIPCAFVKSGDMYNFITK